MVIGRVQMISHRRQQEVFGDYSRNWVGGRAAPRIGIQKVQLKNQKLGRVRLRAVDDCLQLPTEELQERLAANESELTKILGIGIPCEPVPKVVVAAFLPEGNKPKAKSEAEVSLVKSPKPEETLEDELKPKGFGLGLK